jgi:hypothetical protein
MNRSLERILLTGLTVGGILWLAGGIAAAQTPAEASAPAVAQTPVATAGDDDPALEMALDEETGWQGEDDAAAAALEAGDSSTPSQEAAAKLQELRRNEFFYQSYGRGDPFKTLVAGKFEGTTSGDLVDVSSGRLVGVMWGPDDQFALVEDGNGFGYILRVGDPVQNGRVVSIRKNSLTAKITLYGITSSVTLKLEKSEG